MFKKHCPVCLNLDGKISDKQLRESNTKDKYLSVNMDIPECDCCECIAHLDKTPRKLPIDVTPQTLKFKKGEGVSITQLAKNYGVSRTRIQELIKKAETISK